MSGFAAVWAASSRISHAALLSFRWLLVAWGGHGPPGDTAAPTGERGRRLPGCSSPVRAERWLQNGGSRMAQSLPRHCHLKDLFLSIWLKHWGRWFIVLLVPSHIQSKTP